MKRSMIIIGSVVLVLAGAAFLAGRMLINSSEASSPTGGGSQMVMTGGDGSDQVILSLDIKPAPELPNTSPEVAGVYVRREDNSIFVGTGEVAIGMSIDETGEMSTNVDFSGPVLEVVVTRDTKIYHDQTEMPSPNSATSGDLTVQQVVQPVDSLADFGERNKVVEIQVWGTRRGDRVVAEVFVYNLGVIKAL
jgi:hypothetical protein